MVYFNIISNQIITPFALGTPWVEEAGLTFVCVIMGPKTKSQMNLFYKEQSNQNVSSVMVPCL